MARSADIGGSVVLASGLFAVGTFGPRVAGAAASAFRQIYAEIASPRYVTSAAGMHRLMSISSTAILATVAPIAGACLAAGLVTGAAQVGFRPAFKPLSLDFKRVNPLSGARNIFGPNAIFETAKAVTKIGVVAGVAALALVPGMTALGGYVGVSPGFLGTVLGQRALSIAERAVFVYLAIAVIDYAWQHRRHRAWAQDDQAGGEGRGASAWAPRRGDGRPAAPAHADRPQPHDGCRSRAPMLS